MHRISLELHEQNQKELRIHSQVNIYFNCQHLPFFFKVRICSPARPPFNFVWLAYSDTTHGAWKTVSPELSSQFPLLPCSIIESVSFYT